MVNKQSDSRAYLYCFLGIVLSSMAILLATAVYVEPLEGELTRIGGYAERDFGWNTPRLVLGSGAESPHAYDKYYDIVVLGDSFSKPGLWQSFLKQATGLSFTTLHWDDSSLDEVLNHPLFKRAPPKIVIAESGSRLLPLRFASPEGDCEAGRRYATQAGLSFEFKESPVVFSEKTRATATEFSDINLKFALLFLEKSALRLIFNTEFSKVKRYALSRDGLFSSRNNRELLMMQTWFEQRAWTPAELAATACGIFNAQRRVQANGKTVFLLLPIPDKGTAYAKYIQHANFVSMSGINPMMAEQKINSARLDILLQTAIDHGEKDVYLPNDTHFGTLGYALAAKSVVDFLRGSVFWASH